MKQLIIIILLTAFNFNASSQEKMKCEYLDSAIHCAEFTKRFSVNKYESSTLVIIDKFFFVDSCNLTPVHNRLIVISRDQKYNINKKVPDEAINVIVMTKVEKIKKKFRLSFWRPINNTFLVLEVTGKKDKIRIEIISSGSI